MESVGYEKRERSHHFLAQVGPDQNLKRSQKMWHDFLGDGLTLDCIK